MSILKFSSICVSVIFRSYSVSMKYTILLHKSTLNLLIDLYESMNKRCKYSENRPFMKTLMY